jgi:glycosyltransferase involved in cell wall biosynthesis
VLNRLAVIVPAHNEELLLPGCLRALHRAVARSPVSVEVVVVLDACTDATAQIARAAGAHTVAVDARNVGIARAVGVNYVLRHGTEDVWLATTDADSVVPVNWLRWHAACRADVLVGTVAVADWRARGSRIRRTYEARYADGFVGTGHRHVHGANLGCTAAAYVAVGGFAPLRHGEDRDLVTRALSIGLRVARDRDAPVRTSARRVARAPNGFATYLDALES